MTDFIVQKEEKDFPAQDLNSQPSNLQADALSTTPRLLYRVWYCAPRPQCDLLHCAKRKQQISHYTTAAVEHGAACPIPQVTEFIVQKEETFFPSPRIELTTFQSPSRHSIHYTTAAMWFSSRAWRCEPCPPV